MKEKPKINKCAELYMERVVEQTELLCSGALKMLVDVKRTRDVLSGKATGRSDKTMIKSIDFWIKDIEDMCYPTMSGIQIENLTEIRDDLAKALDCLENHNYHQRLKNE